MHPTNLKENLQNNNSNNMTIGHLSRGKVSYKDNNKALGIAQFFLYSNIRAHDDIYLVNKEHSDFPEFRKEAVLTSNMDIAKELMGKPKRDIDIVSYDLIKVKGWQIIKRPITSYVSRQKGQAFVYLLYHKTDTFPIAGSILLDQPQNVLIQIDNIKKRIRLIGKSISYGNKNYTEWRRLAN